MSIAVPAVATQVYDVFYDFNDGAPVLVLTAWTNDTTRATALTTQEGVLVKSGDTQQRYLGTVRTIAASQLNDAAAYRHVWNYYNRVDRLLKAPLETANSWNNNAATWQQANSNTANQLDIVNGVAEDMISVEVQGLVTNSAGGALSGVGVGVNVTNAATSGGYFSQSANGAAGIFNPLVARYSAIPAIGRTFYAWVEFADATITTSFYGDNASPTLYQSGIQGRWRA